MVIYDLICDGGHEFEGWFKNPEELGSQQSNGMLTCPYCDSGSVNKKVTASKVASKSNSKSQTSSQSLAIGSGESPQAYEKLQRMLSQVHEYIDANFVDVGNRFTDEAISIHRGEKETVNIRGTANQHQIAEMAEEGVIAAPLPPKPVNKKKLN